MSTLAQDMNPTSPYVNSLLYNIMYKIQTRKLINSREEDFGFIPVAKLFKVTFCRLL